MNQVTPTVQTPAALTTPQVRLDGGVDDAMLRTFKDAFAAAAEGADPIVVELTTTGGDAETGRRIATDVRLFREQTGRRPLFLGKASVYSAGVSVMAGFAPQDRWLARGTMLLIHGRSLTQTLELNGPLKLLRPRLEGLLNEIDSGLKLEREGFEQLVAGSRLSLEEVMRRSETNWYLDADEALALGLVAGVI
jgi:ATP-dependent protease ClpP protease subunit